MTNYVFFVEFKYFKDFNFIENRTIEAEEQKTCFYLIIFSHMNCKSKLFFELNQKL